MKSKTVSISGEKGAQYLHVETDLGIVNIYVGLRDVEGRRVERIELLPDDYAGQPKVETDNHIRGVRFIEELP
jgi:hypothetical protein